MGVKSTCAEEADAKASIAKSGKSRKCFCIITIYLFNGLNANAKVQINFDKTQFIHQVFAVGRKKAQKGQ
jgi:hypothetical protein